jgi:hypothetical protein
MIVQSTRSISIQLAKAAILHCHNRISSDSLRDPAKTKFSVDSQAF